MDVVTWITCAILLAIIGYDIANKDQLPHPIQKRLDAFSSPFRNFLTINDLDNVPGEPVLSPPWKTRALALLAIMQVTGWLAAATYAAIIENKHLLVQCTISILVWVRSIVCHSCVYFLVRYADICCD